MTQLADCMRLMDGRNMCVTAAVFDAFLAIFLAEQKLIDLLLH